MRKKIFVLIFIIISWKYIYSNGSAGTNAAEVLLISPHASLSASGNAGTGLIRPNWQYVRLNPAHLSLLSNNIIGFSHNKYLEDMHQNSLNLIQEFNNIKYYVGLDYFGYGNFDRVYDMPSGPASAGEFSAYSYIVKTYFSLPQIRNIYSGFGLKYFFEKLDSYSGNAIAFDLGFLYILEEYNFAIGLTLENFGTKIKYHKEEENLPLLIRAGLSYNLNEDNFILLFDAEKINNQSINYYLGIKYTLIRNLSIRCGLNGANDSGKKITTGFDFQVLNNLEINYAFIPGNYFDDSHRFSLSYSFDSIHKSIDKIEEESKIEPVKSKKVITEEEYIKSLEYYNQAAKFYNRGDYINSLKKIKKAIILDRDNLDNIILLLYIYYQIGDFNELQRIIDTLEIEHYQHPKIIILLNYLNKN